MLEQGEEWTLEYEADWLESGNYKNLGVKNTALDSYSPGGS